MSALDPLKITRKTFFNPSAWLGYEQLKLHTSSLFGTLKAIFTVPTPTRQETFEEAMERQGLTEEDLADQEKTYYTYAMLFVLIGALVFIYGFYLLARSSLGGWMLAMACTSLFYAQAFKYHFYYFQIKQRKLGCTFAEWKHWLFN